MEIEYNRDSLLALFVEIIRNSGGDYETALMAVFKFLVMQAVSWMMDIPLFTFKGRETPGGPPPLLLSESRL